MSAGNKAKITLPLLRFIDAVYATAGQIESIWDQIRYIPPEEGGENTLESASFLVNPLICCPEYLPWLGQLLGIRFQSIASPFTPWDSLASTSTSPPEPLSNWDEWESEPDDKGDDDDIPEWFEIEDFDLVDSSAITDYLRWQVDTAYFGLRGGTPKAIMESAQQALRGDKIVRLTKNHQNDPWQILLETLVSETPDVNSAGGQSGDVLKAIANSVPAGFSVVHSAATTLV